MSKQIRISNDQNSEHVLNIWVWYLEICFEFRASNFKIIRIVQDS